METKKKISLNDIIGAGSGIVLVLILVLSSIFGGMGTRAGVSNSEIPADAQSLVGYAEGRNGTIKVKVIASEDTIYQVQVLKNSETDGIGTPAMDIVPRRIYEQQSIAVDAMAGATISSEAIKEAVSNALESGGLDPYKFGGVRVAVSTVAQKVETGTHVTLMTASDWAEEYPDIYASYMHNSENSEVTDYLTDYPMLKILYEDFGFSKFYSSARGHFYDVKDLTETGRPHAMANCFTCKTANFTAMVNELGDSVYSRPFEDVMRDVNEPISCYNCHANNPGTITVTHSYLVDGVGDDFESIDAATLACGQCHVEYYFDPDSKATALPHSDIDSMNPDDILAFFNEIGYVDYTNPRTGVKQIKVQHPELETFLSVGSQHRSKYTCADCHMGEATSENGTVYKSHYLTSPLNNETLIKSECSKCHTDLVSEVKQLQADVEKRTNEVGNTLVDLTEKLAAAVNSGKYTDAQLDEVRSLARDAQFYWDFVFVENSEGAHNSALTYQCLDKAEALATKALSKLG